MKCKSAKHGDYTVISLGGDIDLSTFPQARKAILDGLAEGDVFVELSGVDYLDSSGVAILVEGYQISKDNAQKFGLVDVSRAAMKVIQLAHLDRVFPIYTDLQDALKAEEIE
jgi:anti-sigma B factor antagonist